MLQDFANVAGNIDWLNNLVAAVMGALITTPILGAFGWFMFKKVLSQQKDSSRKRDLTDDYCPLVNVYYEKDGDGNYRQKIRATGPGVVNLRDIFKTNADLHTGYIHKAARIAFQSDDPIIWNHLHKVIPPEDFDSVMYDICADMRNYFGPLLEGQQEKYGKFVYPMLVAEKSAQRKQIRIFLTTEEQADINTLPTADKLLLETGPDEFERDEGHDNTAHLQTRRRVASQLSENAILKRRTFVAVEP